MAINKKYGKALTAAINKRIKPLGWEVAGFGDGTKHPHVVITDGTATRMVTVSGTPRSGFEQAAKYAAKDAWHEVMAFTGQVG